MINNPTLDLNQQGRSAAGPENINVVQLVGAQRLAVGVHWYSCFPCPDGVLSTRVVARVHCRGRVIFESEPVELSPGPLASGPRDHWAFNLWHVGFVEANDSECRFERCGEAGNVSGCIRALQDFQ